MNPNLLLEREIKVDHPRQVIVGDITYLPLQDWDWAYLATWMDLFSRKIIGWHLADSMAAELVIEALRKAILRERLPPGMIVHSDRGGQYVDTEFRELLNQRGFEHRFGAGQYPFINWGLERLLKEKRSRYCPAIAKARGARSPAAPCLPARQIDCLQEMGGNQSSSSIGAAISIGAA
jgi:transposase InsO family protein